MYAVGARAWLYFNWISAPRRVSVTHLEAFAGVGVEIRSCGTVGCPLADALALVRVPEFNLRLL